MRSASLYAGTTTERDFVASLKSDGANTCNHLAHVDHPFMAWAVKAVRVDISTSRRVESTEPSKTCDVGVSMTDLLQRGGIL